MIRQRVLGLALGYPGFCRDEVMTWIEEQPGVHYVFGLATTNASKPSCNQPSKPCMHAMPPPAEPPTAKAAKRHTPPATSAGSPISSSSWSRARRVIGKARSSAERKTPASSSPDLTGDEEWTKDLPGLADGRALYEKFYCGRGDMENRIKEQQLDLFADRTSTAPMAGNQLRLWFSTFAYLLVARLRGIALHGTVLAKATAGTIRLRLFKVAAMVVVSVRRVHVRMASAFPLQRYPPSRRTIWEWVT